MIRCRVCNKEADEIFGGIPLCLKHYLEEKHRKYTCPFCNREFPYYGGDNGELSLTIVRGWCDDCDDELEREKSKPEKKKGLMDWLRR